MRPNATMQARATRNRDRLLVASLCILGVVVATLAATSAQWFIGEPAIDLDDTIGIVATLFVPVVGVTLWIVALTWWWRGHLEASPTRRAVVIATSAVLLASGVGSVLVGANTATAEEPMPPCPAGAPLRTFDVVAIDVDITINRFGDHDPDGKMYVLADRVADVREQEDSGTVSVGMQDDAIQPLVIRANMGDCVVVNFRNDASGGPFGLHVDGLASTIASAGEAIGSNPTSQVPTGGSMTYRYYVPDDPLMEGAHALRPGPGHRQATAHGLFGALVVEPKGSTWSHPDNGGPIESGWAAVIEPPGKRAFREFTRLYHEIGDENFELTDKAGDPVDMVDPHTDAYRPGARAINYRSEPFMNRLDRHSKQKSLAYNSFTFGDPATPLMRSYVGEPTKIRLMHAGGETFHVFHLHGGGIRWRANPVSDRSWNYQDVGLRKTPIANTESTRLDSQAMGPGESFNLEIEGGAGGVQQTIGDLLEHCHVAEHYNAGMWSFWRVFNTRVPDLEPLPDMPPPPDPVDSRGLIGRTMPGGLKLSRSNINAWMSQLMPPRGAPRDSQDATVWDWKLDLSEPARPLALGAPEDRSDWPDLRDGDHPGGMPGDIYVGDRPKVLFNPVDGRPAHPLLRPDIGQRAPFASAHSGTPFLGPRVNAAAKSSVDPFRGRPDGLCPANAPTRRFGLTAMSLPIRTTRKGDVDRTGMIFALNPDKEAIRAGTKPPEPLAIRANIGDCVEVKFASEIPDADVFGGFGKNNIHIHHVQFDVQGSDGASAGFVYDQSVRPYTETDVKLAASASRGARTLRVTSASKFRPGVWIAVGIGTDDMEIHQIASIGSSNTLNLRGSLAKAWPATSTWVGVEFMTYQWYPDVALDNVFWHDHVDGIRGWAKGLVGQIAIEPPGSTYHDPTTGAQVRSGSIVDIRTNSPAVPGVVNGSFREVAIWSITDNPTTDSTINLRAEPWSDRLFTNPDASLLFSSFTHGDPYTPLPRAYAGDPMVFRTISVNQSGIDTFRVDGHQFRTEPRAKDAAGAQRSGTTDTIHHGISERDSLWLEGGAGGIARRAGDYLYMNGTGRRFRQGAWGILRVLSSRVSNLQPLPGRTPPSNGPALPMQTGGRPPVSADVGSPCPVGAPVKSFDVTAIDLSGSSPLRPELVRAAFVPTANVAAVRVGAKAPEPIVLHVAEGDCLEVTLRNDRDAPGAGTPVPRTSFHVSELDRTVESSGVNVGFSPEQTVAKGESRIYRYFAHSARIGGALVSDLGDPNPAQLGLYGMVVVSPRGATFSNPVTGQPASIGLQMDVNVPGGDAWRDASVLIFDDEEKIGGNSTPYRVDAQGKRVLNYRNAPLGGNLAQDPAVMATTTFRAYAGDPLKMHVGVVHGSEQGHVFGMGGVPWPSDPWLPGSRVVSAQAMGAWQTFDMNLRGGAGGEARAAGDHFYGDMRRPFTEAGLWGLLRVMDPDVGCAGLRPLPGRPCA